MDDHFAKDDSLRARSCQRQAGKCEGGEVGNRICGDALEAEREDFELERGEREELREDACDA